MSLRAHQVGDNVGHRCHGFLRQMNVVTEGHGCEVCVEDFMYFCHGKLYIWVTLRLGKGSRIRFYLTSIIPGGYYWAT